jgi:asparagine synthetase B (glutamine-hydrolysing)
MAHGVEIRVPLLDRDVVDLASRIPVRLKQRGWFDPAAVSHLIESNERRHIDASYIVWSLFSLETWAELFLDNARP